ncbi:MAG: hypothetical protein R3E96_11835 [Planctomycetota bacterium]
MSLVVTCWFMSMFISNSMGISSPFMVIDMESSSSAMPSLKVLLSTVPSAGVKETLSADRLRASKRGLAQTRPASRRWVGFMGGYGSGLPRCGEMSLDCRAGPGS